MALSRRQKLLTGALIFYWPSLFIIAHIPVPQLVRKAHVSDKGLHFVTYLILVFLFWFTLNPGRKVNWRKAAAWWVLLVMTGYGVIDELLQGCMAGRSCDVRDYVANLAGIFTGLILSSLLNFWSALLAVSGIAIFTLTNVARANLTDLIPITNAMFHFFAYGFFTVVWLRCIYLYLSPKIPGIRWLITALALPTVFLLGVKTFSLILGKAIILQDVIVSVAGIATTVFLACLTSLLHRPEKKA